MLIFLYNKEKKMATDNHWSAIEKGYCVIPTKLIKAMNLKVLEATKRLKNKLKIT